MAEPGSYDENLEDLDNVPLASLSSFQPSSSEFEIQNSEFVEDTVVASAIDYPNFDQDEESNMGSHSESEAAETENDEDDDDNDDNDDNDDDDDDDDEDSDEVIVPEIMPDEIPIDIPSQEVDTKPHPESWPTLEILPGGVIKHTINKDGDNVDEKPKIEAEETNEMVYACAKCPQRFKYLFCLVKHVRWHKDVNKRDKNADFSKLNDLERNLIAIKTERLQVAKRYRKKKLVVMDRMVRAMGEMKNIKGFRDKRGQ